MNKQEALEQLKWLRNKSQLKEDKDFTEPLDMAISALEQQTNGWIPVSERLPEENGTYIVTQATHSLRDYDKVLRLDTVCVDFSNGTWRRAKHLEVIAWQPLPPKYKEVSDG